MGDHVGIPAAIRFVLLTHPFASVILVDDGGGFAECDFNVRRYFVSWSRLRLAPSS